MLPRSRGLTARRHPGATAAVCLAAVWLSGCAVFGREPEAFPGAGWRELTVTATAYNSVRGQGAGDGTLTAYGLRLAPDMRIVAVSRDLEAEGLREGVRVRIEGLDGDYQVGDRMAARWRRRIDVYMGLDEAAARRFGVQRVRIWWRP